MLFSLSACKKTTKNTVSDTNTTETQETEIVDGKKTVSSVAAYLVSSYTGKFDEMCFEGYNKSKVSPSDYGTSFSIVVCSNNSSIFVNQIEKITVKSNSGEAVNMSTRTYMLNNERACIVFAKTEGEHKISEFALLVKTYDGEEKLIPVEESGGEQVLEKVVAMPDGAKFGDIVKVKDNYYFILQNGNLSSSTYSYDNKMFSEVIIGIILVPLNNTYSQTIKTDDFKPVFFDTDNLGNYGVKTKFDINNEEIKKNYKDNYKGLFVDFLSLTFTIEMVDSNEDQITEKRNYVMNNTWLKGNFEENYLFKIYPKNS